MKEVFSDSVRWFGRNFDHDGVRYFDYSAAGFEFAFKGTKAVCRLKSDAGAWGEDTRAWLGVYVSGLSEGGGALDFWRGFPDEPQKRICLDKPCGDYVLFESDSPQTVHIRVLKLSEAAFAYAGFCSMQIEGEVLPQTRAAAASKAPKLEFIGDSITCGYGIDGVFGADVFTTAQERADKSYAFLAAKALGAEFQMVSWSGIGVYSSFVPPETEEINNGVLMPLVWPYTDRSAALRLGLEPQVWRGESFAPDIVVVHLGTNDQSFTRARGERIETFTSCYRQLLEAIHRRSSAAAICCCLGLMGQDLCEACAKAVELFARDFPQAKASWLRLDLQDPQDGLATDSHPSAATHRKAAAALAARMGELLQKERD